MPYGPFRSVLLLWCSIFTLLWACLQRFYKETKVVYEKYEKDIFTSTDYVIYVIKNEGHLLEVQDLSQNNLN